MTTLNLQHKCKVYTSKNAYMALFWNAKKIKCNWKSNTVIIHLLVTDLQIENREEISAPIDRCVRNGRHGKNV